MNRLRQLQGNVPVLVQTGIPDTAVASAAHLADAYCIWKPVDSEQLDRLLARARRHRLGGAVPCLQEAIERIGDDTGLTRVERQIVRLSVAGMSYKEIAAVRERSPNTVKIQVSRVLTKVGCVDRVELINFVYSHVIE